MNWCTRDLRSLICWFPRNTMDAMLNPMPRTANVGMTNVPTASEKASTEASLLICVQFSLIRRRTLGDVGFFVRISFFT